MLQISHFDLGNASGRASWIIFIYTPGDDFEAEKVKIA